MAGVDMPRPERFTAGTVGEPGARTFFLQASCNGELVTLKCEKQQVGALAEHLAGLLTDLPTPPEHEVTAADVDFIEPPAANWVVGRMGVAWDESNSSMVLLCEQFVDEEAAEAGVEPESARFRLSVAQVMAFIDIARDLVASGRPPCYLCGLPMEPTGHPCPRLN
jgi:uncharacterized repeat protein (TIGR03847 family)